MNRFFNLLFSSWFSFCLSCSVSCFFWFLLAVRFNICLIHYSLFTCHHFLWLSLSVFFFIWQFVSYPSLPRATSFWLICFPFIFNLFFSSLSMTQPVFPILCAFIVFVAIFSLFSVNCWNFQRVWIQRGGLCAEWDDVCNAASESTFHSTDLLTIRNHKPNWSVISVRYSSWICLLQFIST